MHLDWEEYKADFDFDGSLRDIYVLSTSIADWQSLLDLLNSGVYKFSYSLDGKQCSLPASATDAWKRNTAQLLSIEVGSVTFNCHFFSVKEIEFDIDPREIQSAFEAEQVFAFMAHLGRHLNKEVILNPENYQSAVIFRFLPGFGDIQYIPPSP